ncbi:uncharacterized protein LOC110114376, partial [Dendrobium catenatum]|uniref:uncharacterized protein LOC110114376 n=1 Tax=Dendrobium catenatum TaxID=906689 RepID=UPI0009F3A2A1
MIFHLSGASKNKSIHGGLEDCVSHLAANAVSFAAASFNFDHIWESCDTNQHVKLPHNSWYPPPPGWIKVNLDASLSSSNVAGIGGIFRDRKGRFLSAFGVSLVHWDCSQLDILYVSFLGKFIQDWTYDWNGIIIEGDNLNVIKFFQNTVNKVEIEVENLSLKDFLFVGDFNRVTFQYVKRDGNKAIDMCAK